MTVTGRGSVIRRGAEPGPAISALSPLPPVIPTKPLLQKMGICIIVAAGAPLKVKSKLSVMRCLDSK